MIGTGGGRNKSASSAQMGTGSPRTDKWNPWPTFIAMKVTRALCVGHTISFSLERYNKFMKAHSTLPQGMKTAIMKTLTNSWATSHRYHETPLLPCIFGCEDEKDNLPHYLKCEACWPCAVSAAGLPSAYLSLSGIERLALISQNLEGVKLLGVVYRGYHTIKLGFRALVDKCQAEGEYGEIILLFTELYKDYWTHQ